MDGIVLHTAQHKLCGGGIIEIGSSNLKKESESMWRKLSTAKITTYSVHLKCTLYLSTSTYALGNIYN